ncbi:MAG: serine/threonine-protein kinase sepA-like [Mycoplasmataceae bacterium RV_VA103A]|nr:MAG: serine/threonine-protein kinase sepA-like [Mycoplasmataceae bacterium RV_VA103A]
MKLNFLTSWIQQKIPVLLLLTLVRKAETGEMFKECINVYDNSSYNSLLNFPFNNNSKINGGLWLTLCCSDAQCSPTTEGANCPARPWNFSCRKVSETIFCKVYTGVFCGGIVGNTLVSTNTTIGDCPNINQFAIKALENDTYHGSKDVYCQEITPCPMQHGHLSCYWDNNGWTCDETFGNSCLLQWNNSSTVSSTLSYSPSSTTSTLGTTTIPPSSTPNLLLKVFIPVGTTVGVVVISGVVYYYWRNGRTSDDSDDIPLTPQNRQDNESASVSDRQSIKGEDEAQTQISDKRSENSVSNEQVDFRNNWRVSLTNEKPALERLIGKGGYGEVYRGKWKSQDVVVKKLYLSFGDVFQNDINDIMNEVNILKSLRNKYIIQYYGAYFDNQELLVIMDHAENGNLTKFINDNKNKEQDWNFNNELIKQMTLGLVYIHQQNIIHRDLKSMNILLTNNYQVKISDFGLSRTKIISSSYSKDSVKGTLRWMAPEIIKEKNFSEKSDIYSLGMIIWEIAAKCTTPFKDFDDSLVYLRIINNEKEEIPNNTPSDIRFIIEQCWKDNSNERIILVDIIEIIESSEPKLQTAYTGNLSDCRNTQIQSSEVNKQIYEERDLDSRIDDFNLNELSVQEVQSETSLQYQIQIPPK